MTLRYIRGLSEKKFVFNGLRPIEPQRPLPDFWGFKIWSLNLNVGVDAIGLEPEKTEKKCSPIGNYAVTKWSPSGLWVVTNWSPMVT